MTRLLHMAAGAAQARAWTRPFVARLRELGELEIVEHARMLSDDEAADRIRGCDVLLTSWGSRMTPAALAGDPGRLRYICHLTGGMRDFIPVELVESDVPVTNWGDAQARAVAEGAVLLLLASLKGLRQRTDRIEAGDWRPSESDFRSGMMFDLPLGVYGYGFIGRSFVDMVRPFRPRIRIFDPFATDIPDDCERVESLQALFTGSRAVAIHAGWTDQTAGSVTAQLLALLPDGGVLINTARGAIVDQEALFAELESGRLRAGLDVLVPPEELPAEHPARDWPNLLLTAHSLSQPFPKDYVSDEAFEPMHHICLDNVRRYIAGEELQFRMDRERYELST
jgi:phosphoglycerate dehydrogenase-like enzyme